MSNVEIHPVLCGTLARGAEQYAKAQGKTMSDREKMAFVSGVGFALGELCKSVNAHSAHEFLDRVAAELEMVASIGWVGK